MAAPIIYAGMAVAAYSFGNKAKSDAERAAYERQLRSAWSSFGATSGEFTRSREQQEKFYATDLATTRAKLGASGVAAGSKQWQTALGEVSNKQRKELGAISEREQAWRKTEEYQFATKDYEQATSVGNISKQYGLPGIEQPSLNDGDDNPYGWGPTKIDRFTYEGYKYDNAYIPGYTGKDAIELSTERGDNQAKYVSEAFYNTARPTMDEYYWMNYGGDETKAAEAKAAVQQRSDEFIATYGSPIAAGPISGPTSGGAKRVDIKEPSRVLPTKWGY